MIGILTNAFEQRKANIAKGITSGPENPDEPYELIKGATLEEKQKVSQILSEYRAGTLYSGIEKGIKVTNYRQALSIALNESGLQKSDADTSQYYDGKPGDANTEPAYVKKGKKKKAVKKDELEKDNYGEETDDMEESVKKGSEYAKFLNKQKLRREISKCNHDHIIDGVCQLCGEDGLKKGGEGSKGGKVIGHTKSGKPIYAGKMANHKHYENFSSKEHHEAVEHLEDENYHKEAESHHNEAIAKTHGHGAAQLQRNSKSLEKYYDEDPSKFFEVVSNHYEPEDDGESESKMFENLAKHPKYGKISSELLKKFKKGEDDELDKAVENLLGIQDPFEKAFSDILTKGGKGSNKAGRAIGTTRSGKTVHVFKEANDYGDFEAPDHLEAHKMHLHHAAKVTGVAAVNSRIRAHDHEDLARIKAAKKEQEETEVANQKAQKAKEAKSAGGVGKKSGAAKKPAAKKSVKKALDDFLNRDDVNKAFTEIFEKGDISSSLSTYGDKQPMLFSKTGKEISAKLLGQAVELAEVEAELKSKMTNYEEEIGDEPDSENCSYNNKVIKAPRYSYEFYGSMSSAEKSPAMYPGQSTTSPTQAEKTIAQLCSNYNDCSYKLISTLEDLHAIRIITENLEPTKKYQLSVGQLTSLGF
jgi:hypothetical protein